MIICFVVQMEQLRQLSAQLGHPGLQPLWLAVRRNGINLLKKDVEAFVKKKGEKQVFSAVQPSRGKTVSESLDARWQMALAFGGGEVFMVAGKVVVRFVCSMAIRSRKPVPVAGAQ